MKRLWLLLAAAMLLSAGCALADEAPDLTKHCDIRFSNGTSKSVVHVTDDAYPTFTPLHAGEYIDVSCGGTMMSGVMIRFYDNCGSLTVQLPDGDGWIDDVTIGTHLTDWMGFSREVDHFRIRNTSGKKLVLSEVNIYGSGEKPAACHQWNDCEKADLMLVVGHPDDDLLWFGGLLPTYGGQRGLHVVVTYANAKDPKRKLELLQALWTCGIRDYPCMMNFGGTTHSLAETYRLWGGKERIMTAFMTAVRKYKPDVVITQAESGEYGHGAHKLVADVMPKCAVLAADPNEYPGTGEPWQIKKVYLHMWPENQQHFNWHEPLTAFGGEDSYNVTTRALLCHRSQTRTGFWNMQQGEKDAFDNTCFGLAFTTVGPDVILGDLFENLPQSTVN